MDIEKHTLVSIVRNMREYTGEGMKACLEKLRDIGISQYDDEQGWTFTFVGKKMKWQDIKNLLDIQKNSVNR